MTSKGLTCWEDGGSRTGEKGIKRPRDGKTVPEGSEQELAREITERTQWRLGGHKSLQDNRLQDWMRG